MFCKHNYVYTQGHFYCTKCHHRTHKEEYGKRRSHKKRQGGKIAIGITGVVIAGIIGFMFINGVFEINQENLNESIQNITSIIPEEIQIPIKEKTEEIIKNFEEEQNRLAEEQKLADEKYLQDITQKIHELINEERTSRSISSLGWNPKLANAAVSHSNDMATRNYYSHDSLEGKDFTYRYQMVGLRCEIPISGNQYALGAENINLLEGYYGEEKIAKAAVDGWMDSDGHRINILTKYFKNEGIGVAISGNKVYITQNFC